MKQFIYKINGQEYIVAVNKMDGNLAEVAVNGANYKVELVDGEEDITFVSRPAAKQAPAAAPKATATKTTPSATKPSGGGLGALKAPLPGIIVDIKVKAGDVVKKGDAVVILEAMKMENVLQAPIDGTVTEISVNPGDSVLEGVTLIVIE
jgi:biotin carboxyl carrier protein